MARALAGCHANVVLLARNRARAEELVTSFGETKGRHTCVAADVLDRRAVEEAAKTVLGTYERVDALVNGAGGNNPKATTTPPHGFFDIPPEAFEQVMSLNLLG